MAKHNTSRQKILDAAAELAGKEGSAHVSLDAIAARAGISKGGLLYNFPSKSHLLEALVQRYVDDFAAALDREDDLGKGKPFVERYLNQAVAELERQPPPPSGLLAALAENPALLAPVRQFDRKVLDRMKSEAKDDATVLTLFLIVAGLHSLRAFGTDVLTEEEHQLVRKRLKAMLDGLK